MDHIVFIMSMAMIAGANHSYKDMNCDGLKEKYHTTLQESKLRCFEANSRMYQPLTIRKNRFFYYFDCMIGRDIATELQFHTPSKGVTEAAYKPSGLCEVNIRDRDGDLLCTQVTRCDGTKL